MQLTLLPIPNSLFPMLGLLRTPRSYASKYIDRKIAVAFAIGNGAIQYHKRRADSALDPSFTLKNCCDVRMLFCRNTLYNL